MRYLKNFFRNFFLLFFDTEELIGIIVSRIPKQKFLESLKDFVDEEKKAKLGQIMQSISAQKFFMEKVESYEKLLDKEQKNEGDFVVIWDFTSASYINYTMTMQHLRMLEQLFTGEVPIRYQRHMEKLFVDWAWGDQEAPVGQIVIVDCYTIINPTVYNRVWDDRWLKRYATALIKRQWGENLKKFGGIQLPGGVVLNGDKIFEEAMQEIDDLEKDMENNYGGVLEFFMN